MSTRYAPDVWYHKQSRTKKTPLSLSSVPVSVFIPWCLRSCAQKNSPSTTDKTKTPLLSNPDMLVLQISSYSSHHPRLYSFFITHTIPTLHYTKPILPCLPPITHLSIMLYSLHFFCPFILTRISTHDFFCYIPKVFLMVSILDFFDFFLGGRRQVKMLVVPWI